MPGHLTNGVIGHYRIIDANLGSGSFGTVSLAEDIVSRQIVAIKSIPDSEWDESEYVSLSSLKHPHILRLHDYYTQHGYHYLVTDFARGGDLFDFLEGKPRIEESIVRRLFHQLASCISYVHASGFSHRDLKLENIFLDREQQNVILGDWGFATRWSRNVLRKGQCGTLFYLAPEMIDGTGYYGPEVDMWSLGVVLYYLLVGNLPFDGACDSDTQQMIMQASPHIPNFLSPQAAHLLRSLLSPAKQRITSSEILSHPWFHRDATLSRSNTPVLCLDDVERSTGFSNGNFKRVHESSGLPVSLKRPRTPETESDDVLSSTFSLFDALPFPSPHSPPPASPPPPASSSSSTSSFSFFDSMVPHPLCSVDEVFSPNTFQFSTPDSVF